MSLASSAMEPSSIRRDRLRQQVLEAHGWIIHRVWSADWYLRPQAELQKIEDAVAAARAEWGARDEEGYKPARAVPLSFEAELVDDLDIVTAILGAGTGSVPVRTSYIEASFPVNRQFEPHEAPIGQMVDYVVKIVEVEGPVHIEEITARIRGLWGLARAGSRIRAAVERAASIAMQTGRLAGGPFHTIHGQAVTVRDRSTVSSATLRKPDMLPPTEIEQAMLDIVGANYGAGQADLVQFASRAFGFSATSTQLRSVLSTTVDRLVANGLLVAKGEILVLAAKS